MNNKNYSIVLGIKYLINLFIFVVYSFLHIYIFSEYLNELAGGKDISVGVLLIIAGIWGLCIKNVLLKIFIFKPKAINISLIILGLILIILAFFE